MPEKPDSRFRPGDELESVDVLPEKRRPTAVVQRVEGDVVIAKHLATGTEIRFGKNPDLSGHKWIVVGRRPVG